MKQVAYAVTMTLSVLAAGPAFATAQPATTRIAPPADWTEIPVDGGKSNSASGEIWDFWHGTTIVRNVTRATITPVLPPADKATGAAVLVIPGGGFHFLSMANEGWPIARWLADRGIAAFVLKYRVEPTPDDEAEFDRILPGRFLPEAWIGGTPRYLARTETNARIDAQDALRLIRREATSWKLDPARIGVLGFSAGAITAINMAVSDVADARPDFVGAFYGHMLPVKVPSRPQPLFLAVADDDPAFSRQGFGLVDSWRRAGGSVELHWYEGGGHGFGSIPHGSTSDHWIEQFTYWLEAKKILKRGATE